MGSSPSFIYRNRCGIFCFQRRIPLRFRQRTQSLPSVVRFSLQTKNKSVAKRLARTLSAMMDLRAKQYFKDEESFHRAMKLFQQYLDARSKASSLEQLQEEFFDHLDDVTDFESDLLARAGNYFKSKQLDSGVDPYTEAVRQLTETLSKHTAQQTEHTSVISITLDKAFEEFLMNSRGEWKSTGGMEDNYRKIYFPIFKELVGGISCDQLTKAHINDYIKLVQSLPANKTKKPEYRGMTVRDFLKSPAKVGDGLEPLTKKKYLNNMSRFFKWLRTNDYTLVDLELPFSNVKIKKTRSVDQRSAYTSTDIRKLFNSNEYTKGLHKQASHFWVPLIALYTGARLNEICQLSAQDIKFDKTTSRWVFDINEDTDDDPNKSLKMRFHARLVPIHERLLALGLLDFVSSQKKQKHKKLFPELTYVRTANKYGDKLQRWFNRTYTQKSCGITTKETSFHSLRHTVITHLVNEQGIDPNKIAVGMGQTPQGGVTQTTYTKRSKLSEYLPHFDRIDFDACYDFKLIRRWDKHTYSLGVKPASVQKAVKPSSKRKTEQTNG
jgi:integrase